MSSSILDQSVYMTTLSGRRFTMFDPQPDQIDIEDIAHALSMLCRFTGHTSDFYSVAQHCVIVSRNLPIRFALEGLLHDAAEAYINDLSRPIKHHPRMEAYRELERGLERVIREKFGLPSVMSPLVKHYDNMIVVDEALRFMRTGLEWTRGLPKLGVPIDPWSPAVAKHAFLDEYHRRKIRAN